eukprot:2813257-Rhodomonas_salina.1
MRSVLPKHLCTPMCTYEYTSTKGLLALYQSFVRVPKGASCRNQYRLKYCRHAPGTKDIAMLIPGAKISAELNCADSECRRR